MEKKLEPRRVLEAIASQMKEATRTVASFSGEDYVRVSVRRLERSLSIFPERHHVRSILTFLSLIDYIQVKGEIDRDEVLFVRLQNVGAILDSME